METHLITVLSLADRAVWRLKKFAASRYGLDEDAVTRATLTLLIIQRRLRTSKGMGDHD